MKTQYLIYFDDDSFKLIETDSTFKDVLINIAESENICNQDLLKKALVGCEQDEDMIRICNMFFYTRIETVYKIDEIIYRS